MTVYVGEEVWLITEKENKLLTAIIMSVTANIIQLLHPFNFT